jgi:hypothetical protein
LVLPLLLLFVISVVVLDLTVSWFLEKGSFCDVNVNVNWRHRCCVWLYTYLLGFSFVAPIISYWILGGGKGKLCSKKVKLSLCLIN